jgi:hypothetical protein
MPFEEHPLAKERRHSAVALVKSLLRESPGLLLEHRREFLRLALWKITEAECPGNRKYETRFRSQAVISASSVAKKLRHDHVFQRGKMVDELLLAGPEFVEHILDKAIGCTVTEDEDDRLRAHKDTDGWDRYKKAGITVVDTKTGLLV